MQKVYSHENLAMVQTAKGLLEQDGIQSFLKNEYHAAGGHVGFEMIPVELWVHNSTDAVRAIDILQDQFRLDGDEPAWLCDKCAEENAGSFETCWKCQAERPPH